MDVGLKNLSNNDWEQEEAIPQKNIDSYIEILTRRLSLSISKSSNNSIKLVEEQILPLKPRKRNRSPDKTLKEPIQKTQDPIQVLKAPNTQKNPENQGRARRHRVILNYKQLHSTEIRAAYQIRIILRIR